MQVQQVPQVLEVPGISGTKIAEGQWRLATLLLVPILTLIAVPLSRVAPRQGRYSRLVPAALLYALYFVLLQFGRDAIAGGDWPPALGLWWVHALFLLAGLYANGLFSAKARVGKAQQ